MFMKKTIWEEDIQRIHANEINTTECDILIIGAGIAGVSTAFYLKNSKFSIIVIDKDKVASGITQNTTGKVTYLQGDVYHKIKNLYDENVSKQYFESQKKAVKYVVSNIQKNNIDCDLQGTSSYTFSFKNKSFLLEEKNLLNQFKNKCTYTKNLPFHFPSNGTIKVEDTYTFHPLKYVLGLQKICMDNHILFYENVLASDVSFEDGFYITKTNKGDFKSTYVIIATHYPFFINPGFIPLKTHIEKSYVASTPMKNESFCAITSEDKVHSIRFYKDHLIYGGFNHKLGNKTNTNKSYNAFIQRFHKYFEGNITHLWSNHDIMTEDHMPMIGEIKDHLFLATGFNKWGMTNGTLSGKVISDLILKKKNPYEDLFSPKRGFFLHKFIEDGFHNGKSFMKGMVLSNFQKDFKIEYNHKAYYYVYKKDPNIKVSMHCPHMKCPLLFNEKEKTWDCPCHGSRFTVNGKLISGPSHKNINYK